MSPIAVIFVTRKTCLRSAIASGRIIEIHGCLLHIKSVLPALFPGEPELDNKLLEIQYGGAAMDIFSNLHLHKDQGEREKIRRNLLAYCHLEL